MDFKLPTFSAIVFGVVGGFFSFFLSLQIKTIEMMLKLNSPESTLPSLDKSILFFSNPFVGILIGILVGFLIGLILEWLFRERSNSEGIKVWKKWWFWVIIVLVLIIIFLYVWSRLFTNLGVVSPG